ncbi:MAG: T9SS type A sorting domain-containing protein [Bacteroidales bacterium]
MKKLFTTLLSFSVIVFTVMITGLKVEAQPADGTNFDFSLGDFTNWKGYQAKTDSEPTVKIFIPPTWNYFPDPSTCMHSGKNCFVINSNFSQYDMNVGASKLIKIPSFLGYTKSVQINVDESGANANYLSYDLLLTRDNCMITYNYAMVLEAPGHTGYENPFFQIELFALDANDVETGRLSPSTFYEVVGKLPVPEGWASFSIPGSSGIWQNWRQLSMDLSDYVGQKIRIKINVVGCSWSGHWSYGYFVGKVAPDEIVVNSCKSPDTIATLIAPPGFQKYEWFENPNDLPESQLSAVAASSTPLDVREINGAIPAKFTYNVLSKDSLSENLFVKLTSQVNPGNTPMVTYIKVKPFNTKPVAKFAKASGSEHKVDFINLTDFPQDDPDAEIEYIWDFGDGSEILLYNSKTHPIEENINPSHQYYDSAAYNVKLTAKYNGCSHTSQKTIIPTWIGIEEVENNDISVSIYPNPASNFANIKAEGVNGNAKIIIFNEIGKQIQSINASSVNGVIEKQIDTKKYEKGVYLVKIISEGIETSQKLIIQ